MHFISAIQLFNYVLIGLPQPWYIALIELNASLPFASLFNCYLLRFGTCTFRSNDHFPT